MDIPNALHMHALQVDLQEMFGYVPGVDMTLPVLALVEEPTERARLAATGSDQNLRHLQETRKINPFYGGIRVPSFYDILHIDMRRALKKTGSLYRMIRLIRSSENSHVS